MVDCSKNKIKFYMKKIAIIEKLKKRDKKISLAGERTRVAGVEVGAQDRSTTSFPRQTQMAFVF